MASKRTAQPANEPRQKVIAVPDLEDGGKLNAGQGLPGGSGVLPEDERKKPPKLPLSDFSKLSKGITALDDSSKDELEELHKRIHTAEGLHDFPEMIDLHAAAVEALGVECQKLSPVSKVIRRCVKGDMDPDHPATEQKWCLFSADGADVLGRHGTLEAAQRQERAVQAQKSWDELFPQVEQQYKRIFIPILKRDDDQRIVQGVVLEPDSVDAQGDTIKAAVIKRAAHKFLADFNKVTKLGFMHNDFSKNFELLESYVTEVEFKLNGRIVKAGSWLMTVKVLDAGVWDRVKRGEITGFSIGGLARVRRLAA